MPMIIKRKVEKEYTQCQVCRNPLGSESRDMGYPMCHEHRKCIKCGEPLNHTEARAAFQIYLDLLEDGEEINPEHAGTEVMHARCRITDPQALISVRQNEHEILNLIRLAVTPNTEVDKSTNIVDAETHYRQFLQICDMDHENLLAHITRMEACAALARVVFNRFTDKEEINKKWEKKVNDARQEISKSVKASSRSAMVTPSSKEATEVAITSFMEIYGLENREDATAKFKARQKFIDGMVKKGMPEPVARQMGNEVFQLKPLDGKNE